MTDQTLDERLRHLHAQLQSAAQLDDESRLLLATLRNDIERALNRAHEDEDDDALLANLRDSAQQLEAQHPKLVAGVNDVLNLLSGLGF
jgi:phosphoglycolate phosphatase-like HAD superfamily hydrolase